MSELIREALRHYERRDWWEEMNDYGRKSAARARVATEDDVVAAIHDLRREKKSRSRSRAG